MPKPPHGFSMLELSAVLAIVAVAAVATSFGYAATTAAARTEQTRLELGQLARSTALLTARTGLDADTAFATTLTELHGTWTVAGSTTATGDRVVAFTHDPATAEFTAELGTGGCVYATADLATGAVTVTSTAAGPCTVG